MRVQGDPRRRGQQLLPHVVDTGWFFDTELLVLAQRSGLRIHEVPVDWVDDPDSRVDIIATATADLKGIARMLRGFASGAIPVQTLAAQLGSSRMSAAPGSLLRQAVRFTVIGVASTIAYLLLFLALHHAVGAQAANLLALLLTAIANTAANRRFTFGVRGAAGVARHQIEGLVVFGIALAHHQRFTGRPARDDGPAPPRGGTGGARRRQPHRDSDPLRPVARLGVSPAPRSE